MEMAITRIPIRKNEKKNTYKIHGIFKSICRLDVSHYFLDWKKIIFIFVTKNYDETM